MPLYSLNTLPKICEALVSGSPDFYLRSEKLMDTFKNVLGVIQFNMYLERAKTSSNVTKQLTDAYFLLHNLGFVLDSDIELNSYESNNLPDSDSGKNDSIFNGSFKDYNQLPLNNNFIYHFVENFKNLSDTLKLLIIKKTGEDSLFQTFSEDIGCVLDQGTKTSFFNVRMDDFFYNTSGEGPPTYIPANCFTKISENTFKISQGLAFKTDGVLRSSLGDITKTNLKSDTEFIKEVFDELKDIKTTKIVTKFGQDMGNIISFYKGLCIREQLDNDAQFTQFVNTVEDLDNYLDIFNNNVTATTPIDQTVLS